jgi:tetratricopeptide (TPR) repeat protein
MLIDREFRRIRSDAVPKDQWLRALAVRLRVDYIVWGSFLRTDSIVRLQSSIYDRSGGRTVATADRVAREQEDEPRLALQVVDTLLTQAAALPEETKIGSLGRALRANNPDQPPLVAVVMDAKTRSDVWLAYESLEQATAYAASAEKSRPLLLQAETALQKALSEDARNPFIHQLLASCYYNLASATRDEGDQESAASYSAKYVASLNRAYRDRSRIKWPVLRKEIEADFQLLVRKDYDEAIRLYRELADNLSANPLGTSQRAHWMLAGILAGDWGVAESATDIEQAREHLVDVLAHWPDSVPAQVIRHALRWNEEKGENDFEHLPLPNHFTTAEAGVLN